MDKKILTFLAFVFVALTFSACSKNTQQQTNDENENKIEIITTLFPQYDFTREIVGNRANVTMLLPPGVESHTFEPTPSDMANIYNSDLFIYTGEHMEPWADTIISSVNSGKTTVLDVTQGVELLKDNHEGEDADYHDHAEFDPHIWLDPIIAESIVEKITEEICLKDPVNKEFYMSNSKLYIDKLHKLDEDIRAVVDARENEYIVFGGRFAYQYFLNRYDIKYKTAYDSCMGEAEPSLKRIHEIVEFVKENSIPIVFHEELTTPKVAELICAETGAELLLFSTVHNVTKDEFDVGATYLGIMYNNVENLAAAYKAKQ